jgi:predicted DNA binding CopG/RHH family protein
MAQQLKVPQFANEAEEARWWFDNQDAVSDEFELAAREGRLGHGTVARRAKAAALAAALDPEDAERARQQAERRGMEYHSYLKMVVHEALLLEEKRA